MKAAKTHKILIVDDESNEIEMTKRVLSKTGLEVTVNEATHGEAALELLRRQDELPSLVFLDLKMPGMSGIDTLRKIRSDGRLKNIPVIIMTNSLLESDKLSSYAAGADGFLHKAFDMTIFARDIEALLKRWLGE
jgi:two-component system, response regulator